MTNLRMLCPELNPAQWKLLERTILDCLPKHFSTNVNDSSESKLGDGVNYQYLIGKNDGIAQSAAAITNVFNGDGE